MILTRVDLPAPLSPTRATTSPGATWSETSVSACTAPKRLLTPVRESTLSLTGATVDCVIS